MAVQVLARLPGRPASPGLQCRGHAAVLLERGCCSRVPGHPGEDPASRPQAHPDQSQLVAGIQRLKTSREELQGDVIVLRRSVIAMKDFVTAFHGKVLQEMGAVQNRADTIVQFIQEILQQLLHRVSRFRNGRRGSSILAAPLWHFFLLRS